MPALATIALLGPFQVTSGGSPVPVPQAHQRIVLAALALAGERGTSSDRLLAAIWGDRPPRSARKTLHGYIARLRRLLGPAAIMTQPGGYRLNGQCFEVDISRAQSHLDAGLRSASPSERLRLFGCALALFRGEPLEGVPSALLEHGYAAALRDAGTLALEHWAQEQIRVDPPRAVGPLRGACARQPHRESLWALLVEALAASERRAEALESYQRARRLLVDDLGIEPGPGLRRAQQHALTAPPQSPGQARADAARADAARADAARAVDQLAGQLRRDCARGAAIAIAGPPGAGKTRIAAEVTAAIVPVFAGEVPVTVSARADGGAAAAVAAGVLGAWGLRPGAHPERQLLQAWPAQRAAIVLDDVSRVAQYEWLLPVPPGCGLIVGTTMPRLVVADLDVFELTPYPLSHVLSLLGRARPAAPVTFSSHAARTLDRVLAGLPAAVHSLAARLAAEPELTPDQLAWQLQDPRRRLGALTSRSIDVRAHLQKAYDQLSEPARRAFRLLGWLDASSFSDAVAAAALQLPDSAARDLADELSRAGLARTEVRGTERRHQISHLGRSLAREISDYTETPATRDAAVRRALGAWHSGAVTVAGLSAALRPWPPDSEGTRPLLQP